MPRWPKGHKVDPTRDYAQETQQHKEPQARKRKAERTKARYDAIKKGRVKVGDGKELDHVGSHPTGSLKNVPTKVVSQHANRIRQPKRK